MTKQFKKDYKRYGSIFLAFIIIMSTASCGKKTNNEEEPIYNEIIYDGIMISGVDVGGLSYEDAKNKLNTEIDDNGKIAFEKGDNKWEVPLSEMGVYLDVQSAVEEALEISKKYTEDKNKIEDLKKNPIDITISYKYDLEKISETLKKISVESSIDIDIEKTTETLINNLKAGDIESVITLFVIGEGEKSEEKTLLGSFSTSFSSGDKNRNENLRVACEKINGTVLEPGDIFDMNEALGPQTSANGYKSAGVIENGKIVSAIAGGVCQVTTTIYNAAIFSELKIVERHNHSLMVGYVPLGRDAAVAGTYKNLRFQNDTDNKVYIETYIENNKVVCNIYGHEIHDPNRRIDFEKVWVKTIAKPAEKITEDPNMFEGERVVTYNGKTGAKVDTYKLVYEGDKLVSREWFSSSTYTATADEVTVGTKPKEVEQTTDIPVIGQSENPDNSVIIDPTTPAAPNVPAEPVIPEIPQEPQNQDETQIVPPDLGENNNYEIPTDNENGVDEFVTEN